MSQHIVVADLLAVRVCVNNFRIQGEPPITLENTAVVDKTVIFMHNVGATQELAKRNDKLLEQVNKSPKL